MSNNTFEENLILSEPGRNQKQRNGMWNKKHRPDSVKAISDAQKSRFEFYKKAAANIVTEERVRQIIKETIDSYLTKNVIPTNNNKPNIPL